MSDKEFSESIADLADSASEEPESDVEEEADLEDGGDEGGQGGPEAEGDGGPPDTTDESEPAADPDPDEDPGGGGEEPGPGGDADSRGDPAEDDSEGAGDGVEGGDEELEDLDPVIPVVIDKQEYEVPLSEVVRGYQKGVASDKKFREAAETQKRAEYFFGQFQDFDTKGVGGMPAPIQALIQCMAPRFGGDLAKAQQYLTSTVLPDYIQTAMKVSENPELLNIQWSRHEIDRREAILKKREADHAAEKRDNEVREKARFVAPIFQKACADAGVDPTSVDGKKVDKALVGKIVKGEDVTYEVCQAELAAVAKEHGALLEQKLKSLSAEEVARLNPKLAKKLTQLYAAQIKKSRPTQGLKAGKGKTLSPTGKSRRRRSQGQFAETIGDLHQD